MWKKIENSESIKENDIILKYPNNGEIRNDIPTENKINSDQYKVVRIFQDEIELGATGNLIDMQLNSTRKFSKQDLTDGTWWVINS